MRFNKKLKAIWQQNNSLVCVGLDPDLSRFPEQLKNISESIFHFNKAIIDATHDLVCAFKPQIAYFSAVSAEKQLEQTIDYIKKFYPHIPVILDAKRGDIGSTAQKYAIEAFERYGVDAVTVNPYLGRDSVEPFLSYKDRGTILLCRTSNPGAGDVQDLEIDGEPLYKRIAQVASKHWNTNKNCLLVVGATWPSQMLEIRKIVGDMPLLVPGVGAQGGDVEAMVKSGQTNDGTGMIISSSRSVLYASSGGDFAEAARAVALELRDEINRYRKIV
ncbi:orotidine-5'-phosphate decarboxylase [Desulfogranum japonicum]|uniref:orotidine-5'-phosphate decarboxylase n=1 Tax=Desulfogranum japonicum TaxID=231447 RepID=UPI00048DBFEB|nr:orotidine-5'-phosphate decarboxylase [Desulfogranum japonicum]